MARILIIDDEEIVRRAILTILKRSGHEVIEAFNGVEALRFFRERPADLVITDLKMPEKGGLEVIRELRADFPDLRIIAMTGHQPELLPEAERLGASRTFTKPFDIQEFLSATRELLSEIP